MCRIMLACCFLVLATAAAAEEPDLARSVDRLSAAMDRLAAAIERQAAGGEHARAGQRVEVAVGILGLRMRKVDRLEGELRSLGNETEEMRTQMEFFKTQLAETEDQRRLEGREPSDAERQMKTQFDRAAAMMEERMKSLESRRSAIQSELDAELRGLSSLEAILEDWLEEQP